MNDQERSPAPARSSSRRRKKNPLLEKVRRDLVFHQRLKRLVAQREVLAPDGLIAELLAEGGPSHHREGYITFVGDWLKRGVPTAHEKLYAGFLADLKCSPLSHWPRVVKRLLRAEEMLEKPSKGGRPRLEPRQHRAFLLGGSVALVLPRMEDGFTLLKTLKRQYPDQPESWRRELAKKFYDTEIKSLMQCRTPLAAACLYVARVEGNVARTKQLRRRTVRNAFSFWKRLTGDRSGKLTGEV